jgi:hypothetical protein
LQVVAVVATKDLLAAAAQVGSLKGLIPYQ